MNKTERKKEWQKTITTVLLDTRTGGHDSLTEPVMKATGVTENFLQGLVTERNAERQGLDVT